MAARSRTSVPRIPVSLQSLARVNRSTVLRTVVEVILVALLAAQAARLAWLLAAPPGPVGDWPPADTGRAAGPAPAIALAFDPFHPDARSGPATASASGFRLHAARVSGDSGSAILSTKDGDPQAAFQVGDEVAPGITLAAVGAGHAVLRTGGGEALRQAGLQAGDVLVAVDGNQPNPERLAELESQLASRDEVRLTVQRNGQLQTLTLRTTSP